MTFADWRVVGWLVGWAVFVLGVAAYLGWSAAGAVGLATARQDGPVGVYACAGTQPDGTQYAIALTVDAVGPHYGLEWRNADGVTAIGVGVRVGETLVVYFRMGDGAGWVTYAMGKASLTGRWAPLGSAESYPESCLVGGPARAV